VYAGGFYGLSRPVSDSFGIVMVDKLPNAKVLSNGQEIGETDSTGMMVVPSLASYGHNQITLDAKNIPMDYSISGVSMKISPSLWSGSCISFDALKVQAVTGSLHAIAGDKKVPMEYVEISMKVGDREIKFPTGKGGEFYIENLFPAEPAKETKDDLSCRAIAERRKSGGNYIRPGSYGAWADFEGKRCEFSIVFPTTEDVITDLGEVQCVSP
jgi:outer membrane usher protein